MTAVPAKIVRVRIGTWNLEGRWSPDHLALMDREACDVWLLTEVHIDTAVPGMHVHRTAELMGHRKAWAAIFSTVDIDPQPDPHRATALAQIDGLRLMSSVLPWRTCGPSWPGSTWPRNRERPWTRCASTSTRRRSGAATGTRLWKAPSTSGASTAGPDPQTHRDLTSLAANEVTGQRFAGTPLDRPHRCPDRLGRKRRPPRPRTGGRDPPVRPRCMRHLGQPLTPGQSGSLGEAPDRVRRGKTALGAPTPPSSDLGEGSKMRLARLGRR
jgi:hypothetical protein